MGSETGASPKRSEIGADCKQKFGDKNRMPFWTKRTRCENERHRVLTQIDQDRSKIILIKPVVNNEIKLKIFLIGVSIRQLM
jgi:hypothetical protein